MQANVANPKLQATACFCIYAGRFETEIIKAMYVNIYHIMILTGPRSAVGNVSGNRCESDCRSRGREFDPGPVLYFRGD